MSVETGFDTEGRFAWIRYRTTEPTPQEVMSALRAVCLDARLADLPLDTRIFSDVPAAETWLSERAEIAS